MHATDGGLRVIDGYTFGDLSLMPGYADFTTDQVDLDTYLTAKIKLKFPLVSSPMSKVTGVQMAISLGKIGGIGILPCRNMGSEEQAQAVREVKAANVYVGAAVPTSGDFIKRVALLVEAGADVIVLDTAHGETIFMTSAIRQIKSAFGEDLPVIAGNIATFEGAIRLMEVGADGLRVGIGDGSICTLRIVTGIGVPQITAISEVYRAVQSFGKFIPIIADGGIEYSGDATKALAAGASTIMLGKLLAATAESPGQIIWLEPDSVPSEFRSLLRKNLPQYPFKPYKGEGSRSAIEEAAKAGATDGWHGEDCQTTKVPITQGVEGLIPLTGSLSDFINDLDGGLRNGFQYAGANNLEKLWQKAVFYKGSAAVLAESHTHGVAITDPGRNYHY